MSLFPRILFIVSVALALQSCGGNSGDLLFDAPPPPDANVGGIWDGTATNDLEPGLVTRIIGLVAEDGRTQYFEVDSNTGRPDFTDIGLSFGGFIASMVNVIDGDILIFAPFGTTFAGGLTVVPGTLAGAIDERVSIEGVWFAQTGETGDFAQVFSNGYDLDSSLGITQGNWVGKTSFNGVDLSLTINGQGTIVAGIDGNGCVYTSLAGNGVVLIDPAFNVYEINLNITNCGLLNANDYTGLAFVSEDVVPDDTLTISVNNASNAILIEVTRL